MITGLITTLAACVDPEARPEKSEALPYESTVTTPGIPAIPLTEPAPAEDLDPADNAVSFRLEAAPLSTLDDGVPTESYAYNGQIPGPTLRAKVGDTVTVELNNGLGTATTLHWHGLGVPNLMDGVTWLQNPIAAGEGFTYSFTVTAPGTYWYHPHVDVDQQVDRGLYGMFIVEDPGDPTPDRELLLVFDTRDEAGAGDGHTAPDPARQVWTINGLSTPGLTLTAGERHRVRVLNAANLGYLKLRWPGMRQIAGDQGLLGALQEPEAVVLAPGDRAEFEWIAEQDFLVETEIYTASGGEALGDTLALLPVTVTGDPSDTPGLDWPFAGSRAETEDPSTELLFAFSGGAASEDWMINGEVYPDVSVSTLALGEVAVIELRNLSATEHPFHLHGHRFRVLSIDGEVPAASGWEDTINVGIRQAIRLELVADNPGDWMAHCHLLAHEEGGMMTVLRVE